MASSQHKKGDPLLRLVSDEEAVVYPEGARPNDETPTVISRTVPLVEPTPSSQNPPAGAIRAGSPESVVEGLRGRKLSHFELIEPIGVGGMAAVIRARDTQLDRIVALKILPPEMAKEPENVERFHQEARSAAKLDHVNIARVYFCGEDQGLHFIAFEFVEGMNLRTLMDKRGKLPVAEAIRYIVQIATGLEHAATRGVVHRDVKPSNIIITPQGQAKLVDMGLARNMNRRGERDLTQSGMTLGTFDYISPEQAMEPREADVRSDIYSLGCTLYHLLTGQPPVPDGTPAKKLDHHQHHLPIDPRELNPDIPNELVKILGKMMAKNPKDRYARPIHVVHHLTQVAHQVGGAEGLPEVLLLSDAPPLEEPRSRPFLYIGLALAALVVLTALFSFTPERTTEYAQPKKNTPLDNKGASSTSGTNGGAPKSPGGEPVADIPEVAQTRADLKSVLESARSDLHSKIGEKGVALQSDGLVFRATEDQKLVIESEDPQQNTIVSFKHLKNGSAFGLALECGKEVIFRRITFTTEAGQTPDRVAACLAVRGVARTIFERCIFEQTVPLFVPSAEKAPGDKTPKLIPIASIYIAGADGIRPHVELRECYFHGGASGGQVAIAIDGEATISAVNTAFRPHGAFFSFRDKSSRDLTAVKLDSCAGFVQMGPVFRFSDKAGARLDVARSVFARFGGVLSQGGPSQPGLIYLAANNAFRYEGRDNLYRNLNAFIERKGQGVIDKYNGFRDFLDKNLGSDVGSRDLAYWPFHLSNAPERPLGDDMAFQLRHDYKDYGLRTTWLGNKMEAPLPTLVKLKKIVDPDAKDDNPVGVRVYENLSAAFGEAVDGDVIWIKHGEKREIEVPSVSFKRDRTITLKPFPECDPILVLDASSTEKNSSLFKLQKNKLHIEKMKIQLAAPAGAYDRRSVVQIGESAHLVFDECTFLMRSGNTQGKLNIVTLFDLDPIMMKDTPPGAPPRVEFKKCFVRGKGDLVTMLGCRKLNVDIDDSLLALDGSLLDIEAGFKEMPMDEGVQWNMNRSSIFTRKSLLNLRADTGRYLTLTRARVKDCLLASLAYDPSEPLVRLDIRQNEELKKYLSWEGGHNFYANFFDELNNDLREWKKQFVETDPSSRKLAFPAKLEEAMQARAEPTHELFRPMDREQEKLISEYGMPPELLKSMMPMPTLPEPPEQSPP